MRRWLRTLSAAGFTVAVVVVLGCVRGGIRTSLHSVLLQGVKDFVKIEGRVVRLECGVRTVSSIVETKAGKDGRWWCGGSKQLRPPGSCARAWTKDSLSPSATWSPSKDSLFRAKRMRGSAR